MRVLIRSVAFTICINLIIVSIIIGNLREHIYSLITRVDTLLNGWLYVLDIYYVLTWSALNVWIIEYNRIATFINILPIYGIIEPFFSIRFSINGRHKVSCIVQLLYEDLLDCISIFRNCVTYYFKTCIRQCYAFSFGVLPTTIKLYNGIKRNHIPLHSTISELETKNHPIITCFPNSQVKVPIFLIEKPWYLHKLLILQGYEVNIFYEVFCFGTVKPKVSLYPISRSLFNSDMRPKPLLCRLPTHAINRRCTDSVIVVSIITCLRQQHTCTSYCICKNLINIDLISKPFIVHNLNIQTL